MTGTRGPKSRLAPPLAPEQAGDHGRVTSSQSSSGQAVPRRDALRHMTAAGLDQASVGAAFKASSISANEGWAVEGMSPRPISTEICAALP